MKLRLCAALTETRLWLAFTIDIKPDWPRGGKFLWNRYDKAAFWSSHRSLLKGPLLLLFTPSDGRSYLSTFSCRSLNLKPGAQAALRFGKSVSGIRAPQLIPLPLAWVEANSQHWIHWTSREFETGAEFCSQSLISAHCMGLSFCRIQKGWISALWGYTGRRELSKTDFFFFSKGASIQTMLDVSFKWRSCRATCNSLNTPFCLHPATCDHHVDLSKFSLGCAFHGLCCQQHYQRLNLGKWQSRQWPKTAQGSLSSTFLLPELCCWYGPKLSGDIGSIWCFQ